MSHTLSPKTHATLYTVNGPSTSTVPRRRLRNGQPSWRNAPPHVPRRPQAPVGQMGLRNPGATEEEPHMVGVVSGAGDGGTSIRRRSLLPQRPEGAAQLSRRRRLPAASVVPHGKRHSDRRGPGGAYDESFRQ